MTTEAQTDRIDVKALLGNPKITFVTGAPGSGKGTQCEKLVEEFGYTHISVGDVIRNEIKKGTRDGERLQQFANQGRNCPLELTMQLLINALVANPSQNYLIDGFPREIDQCHYFETHVCEAQTVLFYDCSQQTCVDRLMNRNQGRADDNPDTIAKRFETYQQKNMPVIDYLEQFGKVRRIDANRDPLEVYEDTRRAVLPQISCIIGPKGSGKTQLGQALCERTNMRLLNFNEFINSQNLADTDDETQTVALIKRMSQEICPRVLIEDFPQSEFQAKFFINNCVTPSRIFALECSKDTCQERMISRAGSSDDYQASAILSKRIRQYNENAKKLMPFLQANTNLRIVNTEQNQNQALKQLCGFVEPTILLVRPGGNADSYEKRNEIIAELKSSKDFKELNVFNLIKEEQERHTEVGREISEQISAGKDYTRDLDHLIVKMLKKIIYSGIEGRDKFILSEFPENIKQVQEFERSCARLSAVIFAAGGSDAQPVIELIDNGISIESIDSLLQKDHRLKMMRAWDEGTFNEQLGEKNDWGIIMGQSLSGKTLVAGMVADVSNGKVIDLAKLAEDIRPRLETEDGPFEGRIPDEEVEKDILAIMKADKANGEKFFYLFDGRHHETIDAAANWFSSQLGSPNYIITCTASEKEIENRYKEKNEIADDLGEEDKAALKEAATAAAEDVQRMQACFEAAGGRFKNISFQTDVSKETLTADVRSKFCAKVILVNHEKRIDVDTACSNLAIKFNMLYLSVYQLIRSEILAETDLGRALAASKRDKKLNFQTPLRTEDPFEEDKYSAAHFDQTLVMQLVQSKIAENRTSQRFILLEGLCNSSKLDNKEEQFQNRYMDEFFAIQRNIGEVVGVIGLQDEKEESTFSLPPELYEEPVIEEVKEPVAKAEGEDGEEAEEAAPEGDEAKKPAWNPKEYRWTKTNQLSKNLPQLFRDYMSNRGNLEEKNWKAYNATSHSDAAVKALDEFCMKVTDEANQMAMYLQVIFNDAE